MSLLRRTYKANKYGAVKAKVDGVIFDSIKESKRYTALKMLQKLGEISELNIQVSFDLIVNNFKVAKYVADFTYKNTGDDKTIVEDCKGVLTPVYRLKKKLMKAIYNIEILET